MHLLEEEEEYLEAARVKNLVKTYCDFMPVAIKMDGETLNRQKAPWRESANNLSKEDYLEFYRYLYPFQEEPLLWVHLNTDYPFIINGIMYFPKLRPDVDVSKGQIKLFCNQVFVSDNVEEIIPQFLLPMRGVVDSSDIPLNVSRSSLQGDRTVKRIGDYIAKKVGDRLKELYRDSYEQYISAWKDLGTFVKFGTLNDEKFKKQVQDIIVFQTTYQPSQDTTTVQVQSEEGDAWEDVNKAAKLPFTTLKEYLERNKERHENRVFYCTDPAAQSTYVELHKSQGLEVLYLDSFIDTYFINFLEQEYNDVKFTRVDSDLDNTLLDKDKPAEIVDPTTNKTRSEVVKELFEKAINKPKVNIRTESLKSDNPQGTPPAMVLLPEILRRLRDMNAMSQQQSAEFPEDHILVVNTAHPLIQNLANLSQGSIIQDGGDSPSAQLAGMICQHVYDLALMSQKGFDAEGMKSFVERSNEVLTKLTEQATK
jgi:molecular chaperone HtpG